MCRDNGIETCEDGSFELMFKKIYTTKGIHFTWLDRNVGTTGFYSVRSDAVRPAGFVLKRYNDLLSNLGFD